MSTKIYNGIKFKAKNFKELFESIQKIRPEIEALSQEMYSKYLHRLATELYDDSVMCGVEGKDFFYRAKQFFKQMCDESDFKNIRHPDEDLSFSISVFPLGNKFLGIYHTEHEEYVEILRRYDIIEDYHYQNSTDKPENINTRFWNKRCKDWDKVLGWDKIYKRSFSFELIKSIEFFRFSRNIDYLPSFEQRVKRIASEMVFKDNCKEEDKWFDTLMYLRCEEGLEEINRKIEEIKHKFISNEQLIGLL